jgi:hypothetical protein
MFISKILANRLAGGFVTTILDSDLSSRRKHMFGNTLRRFFGISSALTTALALILVLTTGAYAIAPLSYPNFSNMAGLTLVGSAAQTGGNVLRVVPSVLYSSGAAWTVDKQSVQCGFDTTFTFQITGQTYTGADGLAFVIQNSTQNALGAGGGWMGYHGIPNSLAVEFDTHYNAGPDEPDGNHISVRSEGENANIAFGAPSLGTIAAAAGLPNFSGDRQPHVARITYTPSPGTMQVYLDNVLRLIVAVDLSTLLSLDSGRAWVGFTAATGGASENEDVLNWTYSGNCAPVVTADEADVTVDEGQTATNSGTVSDSDGDSIALTASVGTVTNNGDGTWSWSYDTTDGPVQTQTVTIDGADGSGGTAQATFNLTVNNVAPTAVTLAPTTPNPVVAVNTSVPFDATFTDPAGTADQSYTCSFDWDDNGVVDATVQANYGACSSAASYSTPGVYTVSVTVTDKDGGVSNELTYQYVVVYDPSAGFVTGGGWIDSPAGAYTADATLAGKATFGFVAKYRRGQSTPDGNTQFQFRAGDLNFHSTSYQWLVVAGANAKYRGVGTINGQGAYDFMVTARDGNLLGGGQADGFRIKIWDAGGVVYDNKIGEGDDSNATTDLGGGSIVIHSN